MILVLSTLVTVQLIFSLWPVLIKSLVAKGYSPLYIVFSRDILASSALWLAVWAYAGFPALLSHGNRPGLISEFPKLVASYTDQEKLLFVGLAAASTINSIGYVLALEFTTPFNSALLHPMVPVLAAVVGSILGIEEITKNKILGFTLCIVGSIAVIVSQSDISISGSYIGNALLLLQSLAMAMLLVGQKFVDVRHSALQTTAIYYSLGTVLSSPICILILLWDESLRTYDLSNILVILFGAIFVVAFNYVAMTWTIKESAPSITAASMLLQPPFTYILGVLFLGQQTNGYVAIFGGSVIVGGLVLTLYPDKHYNQLEDEPGILLMRLNSGKYDYVSDKSQLLGDPELYDPETPTRIVI
jgi:drug/metabolite transporter (DMT)-like permease